MRKLKAYIRKEDIFGRDLNLYFLEESQGKRACISKIEWTELPDFGSAVAEPIPLQPEEAQQLIDALWDIGLRPSEGSGSAGAMAATQKHLEDMRTLVFKPPAGSPEPQPNKGEKEV